MVKLTSDKTSKLVLHDLILDVVNDMICNNSDPVGSVLGQIVTNE